MYSMTGYGRADYADADVSLSVEIRSVNNRNLDLNCRLPRGFVAYEEIVRKCVREKIVRGRVDVFVAFSDKRQKTAEITCDDARAAAYVQTARALSGRYGLENDFTVSQLMRSAGVLAEDAEAEDYGEFAGALEETTRLALERLGEMRANEGGKLAADLAERMKEVEETVDKIAARAPEVKRDYAIRLRARIEELLGGVAVDEARLVNEIAVFADRADIAEEITRLKSHEAQFYVLLGKDCAGRQLDFLVQEFNREANTICSKSNDVEITRLGLNLKSEIEKIREQVQNLE